MNKRNRKTNIRKELQNITLDTAMEFRPTFTTQAVEPVKSPIDRGILTLYIETLDSDKE